MSIGLSNFPSLSVNSVDNRQNTQRLLDLRKQMNDQQRQLNTGQVTDSYAGLGTDAIKSLNLHQAVSLLGDYADAAKDGQLRLKLMDSSLTAITKSLQTSASALNNSTADTLLTSGQTFGQSTAASSMQAVIDSLNTDAAGRYLFAGRATDKEPVLDYGTILNGTATAAGLKQIIAERKAADNPDGKGLMTIGPVAGSSVTLTGSATTGLGMGVAAATSASASVTTGIAGSPAAATINFTGVPQDGETVQISLSLPDGTTKMVTLTARAGTPDLTAGEFQIGGSAAATATNFLSTLTPVIQRAATTDLASASAMKASRDFFASNVNAPYTRLSATPPAATVQWYRGDTSATPRSTAQVQVSRNRSVDVGAQANEPAFQEALAQLAALSAETFSSAVSTDKERYRALVTRATPSTLVGSGKQTAADVQMELGQASAMLKRASDNNAAQKNTLQTSLSDLEDADTTKVAVTLSDLNIRLQASYQTTAMLSKLTLTNYL